MYVHFAKKFLEKVSHHQCQERVKYLEYFKEGWTYHGKGLWYYPAKESLPVLTLMGSSNYGKYTILCTKQCAEYIDQWQHFNDMVQKESYEYLCVH